jgi:hypothetical protein
MRRAIGRRAPHGEPQTLRESASKKLRGVKPTQNDQKRFSQNTQPQIQPA